MRQSAAVRLQTEAEWGFLNNVINIDTFFAAPKDGSERNGGGLQTAAQLDADDSINEKPVANAEQVQLDSKRQKKMEARAKVERERQAKELIKKEIEKEAAEKAVEAMMVGLDEDVEAPEPAIPAKKDDEPTIPQALNPQNLTLVYSLPSDADKVLSKKANVTSIEQL